MATEIITFEKKKETKNAVVFDEKPEAGKPTVIGSLYVKKWFAGEKTSVKVTIEV